ncbi:MAG: hypothetical protein Q7R41_10310, partial [Phycisphaerales bacterium]|nr:hypothetical protein [Phycisphaerales bacterium]
GTRLLGVRAVIAESYERIHRGNLVGMGVWPLEFRPGENRESLGLTGHEVFDFTPLPSGERGGGEGSVSAELRPRQEVSVKLTDSKTGASRTITLVSRIDTAVEVSYYRNGGILPYVLRKLAT